MKKILAIALVFVLCFTLFACGDENKTDTTTTTTSQNTTTTTTTEANTTTTTKNDDTTTTTTKANTTTPIDAQDIAVIDAVNCALEWEQTFKVRLPKIVGNTDAIEKINQDILNDALPEVARIYGEYYASWMLSLINDNDEYLVFNKGATFDYTYAIKNDVLVVYTYSTVPPDSTITGSSGDGMLHGSYCYDIANDKLLTISQTVERLGLDMPEDMEYFYPGGLKLEDLDDGNFYIEVSEIELEVEWMGI